MANFAPSKADKTKLMAELFPMEDSEGRLSWQMFPIHRFKMPDFTSSQLNASSKVSSVRMLVVDADTSVSDMIRDNFSVEGVWVDRCQTADETFNIDLSRYKVVLLDLGVDNDSNGLGLVEQIKQMYGSEKVAVIAYSVKMSPETIIEALNAGADDYLIKPFSVRELKARVRSVMRRH